MTLFSFGGRLARFVPGVWLGGLLCIAFLVTPVTFAVLGAEGAGPVVRRIFGVEAPVSLVLGMLVLTVERRSGLARLAAGEASQFTGEMQLALGALFCTVAGYYGLQPLFEQARAGAGPVAFGTLHVASTALYGVKTLLVAVLAWKAAAGVAVSPRAS